MRPNLVFIVSGCLNWHLSKPFKMTAFVPKYFDFKLNFCCNELKFKLNWYICANTSNKNNFTICFDLILYIPVNNFSVMLGHVILG